MKRPVKTSAGPSLTKIVTQVGVVLLGALAVLGSQQAAAGAATMRGSVLVPALTGAETQPGAPAGLSVSSFSGTSVSLSWGAPASDGGAALTHYAVQYREATVDTWTDAPDVDAATPSTTVTGLTLGTKYEFRVGAVNAVGTGWTASGHGLAAKIFPIDSDYPNKTEDGRTACHSATAPNLDFTWDQGAPAIDGSAGTCSSDYFMVHMTGEIVWPGTYDGTTTRNLNLYGVNDDGLQVTIGGNSVLDNWDTQGAYEYNEEGSIELLAGQTYPVDVWMYDATEGAVLRVLWDESGSIAPIPSSAFSAISQIPSTVPTSTGVPTASPLYPAGLAVSWTAPVSDGGQGVTRYELQHSADGGTTWLPATPLTSTTTSSTVMGLASGETYLVRTRAVNPVGNSTWTESAAGVLLVTHPAPPTGLLATPHSATSVALSWRAPADMGGSALTGYTVEYRALASGPWLQAPPVDAGSTSATVTSLTQGTPYEFRVLATNAVGDSAPSGHLGDRFSAAGSVSCAVAPDATVRCWGDNGDGQLGDGTTNSSSSPVEVSGVSNAVEVAVGSDHVCALIDDGTIQCWGSNGQGQLGDGTMDWRSTPSTVTGVTNAVAIAMGDGHSCAVLADNSVKCWGRNWNGQLGNGTTDDSATPILVPGIAGALSLTASTDHTCVLLGDGTVRCWGGNWDGQLGNGTKTNSLLPVAVTGLAGGLSLSANSGHTCAVITDGTISCWGSNGEGQLGDGTTNRHTTPVTVVGVSTAVAVTTGDDHACAVLADGTMRCWGANWSGQLGDGTTDGSTSIRTVSGLSGVAFAASGNHHTCAIARDGGLQCWGENGSGQLGDGTTDERHVPVAVTGVNAPAYVSAIPSVAPSAPGAPSAQAAFPSSLTVSWTAPTDNGGQAVTGYLVRYSDDDGASWSTDVPAAGTTVRIPGLTAGASYKLRVRAANPAGVGDWSPDSASVQLVTPPGPPTGFAVRSYNSTSATVQWAAPANTGGTAITGYTLEYRATDAAAWTTASALASDAVSATVSGLTKGTLYVFRIRASNAQGDGYYADNLGDRIGATTNRTCAVSAGGAVSCWGSNNWGQFGDGTTINSPTPVKAVGVSRAVAVAVGYDHTCALIADGSARCWGRGTNGQLGNGNASTSSTAVTPTGVEAATSIAAGDRHTCVRLSDGTVSCWGDNGNGQLGDGTTSQRNTAVSVSGLSGAVAVSAGADFTCALRADGSVSCWGSNGTGQLGNGSVDSTTTPVAVRGLSGAVALSSHGDHSCAVLSDGSVKCWGGNSNGKLGNGSQTRALVPVDVIGISTATVVAAGNNHTCAVLADGTMRCWGRGGSGELGNDSTSDSLSVVTVSGLEGAVSATAGGTHSCAVLVDGTMRCWGDNGYGRLGDGTTSRRTVPVTVSGLIAPAYLNAIASVAPDAPGTPSVTPAYSAALDVSWTAPAENGGQAVSGYLVQYSSDNGVSWAPVEPIAVLGTSARLSGLTVNETYKVRVKAVSLAGEGSAAVSSGTLLVTPPGTPTSVAVASVASSAVTLSWTAPSDNGGSALTGYTVQYRTPDAASWSTAAAVGASATGATVGGLTRDTTYVFRVRANNAQGAGTYNFPLSGRLAAGVWHTCAALADGTQRCWGENGDGEIGDGTWTDRTTPRQATGVSDVSSVAAGDWHSCVLLSDGTGECWGWNFDGQLGNNTRTGTNAAVTVSGLSGATALSGGDEHTCAIVGSGSVKCWGANGYGQIGDASYSRRVTPVAVTGISSAVSIGAGTQFTCAVLADGTARCWGNNTNGRLGDGTTTTRTEPVAVTGVSSAVSVSAGISTACALINDGTVRCWGYNNYGQLGNGTFTTRYVAGAVQGVTTAVSLTVGDDHACAALADGTAVCWGSNGYGQLGDGSTTNRSVPVAVSGLTNAVAVTAGSGHTCALLGDGAVKCWGRNSVSGQLGDGTYTNRLTPVSVSGTYASAYVSGTPSGADTAPDAPTGVSATAGAGSADVSWTAPVNDGGQAITGYTVTSSPDGLTCTSSTSPCTVSGLTNGTSYTFTVVATNSVGDSVASSASTAVTPSSEPGAPTGASATAGAGSAEVSWTAPTSDGGSAITGYTVTSSPGGLTCTASASPCTVTGLTRGTSYTFTVVATNAVGNSVASDPSTSVVPLGVPDAPTGVSATASPGAASVTWSTPASDGGSAITGYTVTSSPGGLICSASAAPCTVSGLTNGTSYTFTVVATNSVGNSVASAPSAAVVPATVPDAPRSLAATHPSSTSVGLTWTAPATNGGAAISDYLVQFRVGGALTWTSFADGVSTTRSAVVTGLVAGTSYDFRVASVNAVGSTWSAPITTAAASAPGPVSAVSARAASVTSLTVTWAAPAVSGGIAVTDYAIATSTNNGSSWSAVADGTSTTTSATISGLSTGSTYLVRVAAINPIGQGAWTNSTPVLLAVNLTPAFGSVTSSTAGFTVQVSNYAGSYSWAVAVTSGSGSAKISSAGLVTVSNVTAGTTTVSVTTSVSGMTTGTASVTGSATPVASSFAPTSASRGAAITVTGTNLWGATAVTVGGVAVPKFTVVSPTTIVFGLSASAVTGRIVVTTPAGSATSATNLTVSAGQSSANLTGSKAMSVTSGGPGTSVLLTGAHLGAATAVTLGGVVSSFAVLSDTTILVGVPAGGRTGSWAVTTAAGTASSATFTYVSTTVVPTITSRASSALGGTLVTLAGTNVGSVTRITVNGVSTSYAVESAKSVVVFIPANAAKGVATIILTTPGGTATSTVVTVV